LEIVPAPDLSADAWKVETLSSPWAPVLPDMKLYEDGAGGDNNPPLEPTELAPLNQPAVSVQPSAKAAGKTASAQSKAASVGATASEEKQSKNFACPSRAAQAEGKTASAQPKAAGVGATAPEEKQSKNFTQANGAASRQSKNQFYPAPRQDNPSAAEVVAALVSLEPAPNNTLKKSSGRSRVRSPGRRPRNKSAANRAPVNKEQLSRGEE
jgi:hypothetical protein